MLFYASAATSNPSILLRNEDGVEVAQVESATSTATVLVYQFPRDGEYSLWIRLPEGGEYSLRAIDP